MPANPAPSRFYRLLYRRWWFTFLLLGLSFVFFGVATLNLLYLFKAAWDFLLTHGFDAVREGVLLQLVELVFSGYLAAAFYVLFKVCEKVLVDRATSAKGN
jgi:hypothetical protein